MPQRGCEVAVLESVILFALDKAAMNCLGDGGATRPVRLDNPQHSFLGGASGCLRCYEQYVRFPYALNPTL